MESSLTDWLRLAHTTGLSLKNANSLLDHFGNPATLFHGSHTSLREAGCSESCIKLLLQPIDAPLQDLVVLTRRWLQSDTHTVLHRNHADYPVALRSLADPPVLLYVKGDPKALNNPQIAIVGSRKATAPARQLTASIAQELTASGLCIVSGLAQGIDATAHQACLDAGGETVAVTGTGLDRVYPACHRHLAEEISQRGALVSEFPLGSTPKPWHFPRRNRIISGLSVGVVVVEATLRSGTLTTARHAMDQGREVMAVPGSVRNAQVRGCHELIRQGAILVQSATDILSEIAPQIDIGTLTTAGSSPIAAKPPVPSDPNSVRLLETIGYEPASIDTLVSLTGRAPGELSAAMLKLELDGHIVNLGSGRYARC